MYEGRIASVRVEEFRYDDGSTAEREVIGHPGAVVIAAHDAEMLWMVRQPREPVGEPALLELPAGKLDVPGESPLDCAKRELGATGMAKRLPAVVWARCRTAKAPPG